MLSHCFPKWFYLASTLTKAVSRASLATFRKHRRSLAQVVVSSSLQREGASRGRRSGDSGDEPSGTQRAGGSGLGEGRRTGAGAATPRREEGDCRSADPASPAFGSAPHGCARLAEARASAPLTGTLPFKAGARAHPAPPFGGARGGGRTGSRELTCRRGAKEPGARGRAGGGREGGREAPGARARAGRCWAAAAVTMAESAGASSFFPLVVLLLAGSGGSGPRGIQGESGAGMGGGGAGYRRPGEASRSPWGSGAPPPQPRNMAGRGARRAGVALGQPWGPARSSRRSPTGAPRGSRLLHPPLPPQASSRCGGPWLLPFSASVRGGLFPASRCSWGRLFSRQDCGVRRWGACFSDVFCCREPMRTLG